MIDEHSQHKVLSISSRKDLINAIYEYLTEDKNTPSEEKIIVTCKAVIEMFPFLKVDRSAIGGIVS